MQIRAHGALVLEFNCLHLNGRFWLILIYHGESIWIVTGCGYVTMLKYEDRQTERERAGVRKTKHAFLQEVRAENVATVGEQKQNTTKT